MMTPLDQLRMFRDTLRRRLDADETFVTWIAVDQAIRQAEGKLRTAESDATNSLNLTTNKTADHAFVLIQDRGEPLSTDELIPLLQARGVSFTGANPSGNLASVLSKDKRLRSVKWGGPRGRAWWLASAPYPGEGITSDPNVGGCYTHVMEAAGPPDQSSPPHLGSNHTGSPHGTALVDD
jgi:hypothetical protein